MYILFRGLLSLRLPQRGLVHIVETMKTHYGNTTLEIAVFKPSKEYRPRQSFHPDGSGCSELFFIHMATKTDDVTTEFLQDCDVLDPTKVDEDQ